LPWKRIRLEEDKAVFFEPLVEPPVSKAKPKPKFSLSQERDPTGGWKKFLLEGDPVFLASETTRGNFLFPTGETAEVDISTLTGAPDLSGTKRRRYGLYFDMTGVYINTADWKTCTTRVKSKVDGEFYRTIDRKDFPRGDFAPWEEPAIPIDLPPLAEDVTLTMQFDVGLATTPAPPRIYWSLVELKLEP